MRSGAQASANTNRAEALVQAGNGQLSGFKFRRQYPIGPFIADSYCATCRLIVEIDGESHGYQEDYDAMRTDRFSQNSYRVIRFSNQIVGQDINAVLETILAACEESTLTPGPSP